MFVDSHCHLSAEALFAQMNTVLERMAEAQVTRALCVSTSMEDFARVDALCSQHSHLWASVGVHPEEALEFDPTYVALVDAARRPKVVAIGETGLDYYQFPDQSHAQLQWQRERFQVHIDAARESGLPLIIHTRAAAEDTLAMLREAVNAPGNIRGVFHCFSETFEVAKQALNLGFYISFSGILTFKNAVQLREVAQMVPRDACLIETDSPYLAPVPLRGKLNMPSNVPYVAQALAALWQTDTAQVGAQTTWNFDCLFSKAKVI